MDDVLSEVKGRVGLITLNRPKALNALSLDMVRALTAVLLRWQDDPQVLAVAVRGQGKEGPFGAFCAGGDIRFFHQAALAGDARLEDFFTEEYTLNHLVHHYAKPYVAFMDGIVMGGGMGISQGAALRVVTSRTKMAMPETNIGLFPDVGGGFFLSRCPGRAGEYLALTGEVIGAGDALAFGLADAFMTPDQLPVVWETLGAMDFSSGSGVLDWLRSQAATPAPESAGNTAHIDRFFAADSVQALIDALEAAPNDEWATRTAQALRKRSPLMLHVVLEQVRRARTMTLAEDLRMERDLVRNCFQLRPGAAGETVEGIRALAVDKDHTPRWNPARIEDVSADEVTRFFTSPWPAHAHALRGLA